MRGHIRPRDFTVRQQAGAAITGTFRYCNRGRLHSAPKYVPPEAFPASWGAAHNLRTGVRAISCREHL